MPKIETEINNVLNQVVDFNMVLNTDGKNINGYIIYDEDNFTTLTDVYHKSKEVQKLVDPFKPWLCRTHFLNFK